MIPSLAVPLTPSSLALTVSPFDRSFFVDRRSGIHRAGWRVAPFLSGRVCPQSGQIRLGFVRLGQVASVARARARITGDRESFVRMADRSFAVRDEKVLLRGSPRDARERQAGVSMGLRIM